MSQISMAQIDSITAAVVVSVDPYVVQLRAMGDRGLAVSMLRDWLNSPSSQTCWHDEVSGGDLEALTNFVTYDGLSAGKRDSWRLLTNNSRDPRKAKIRKAIVDVWGAATAGSNAESILQGCTRMSSNAEKLVGGTIKTEGTVSAIDCQWHGTIGEVDSVMICYTSDGVWRL